MAAPTKPRKVQAIGKDSWYLVPAVANISTPTLTEINAATGINVSCALLASFEGVSTSTGRVTTERLLCETEQYEGLDVTTYSMTDIVGAFDPQAADASDDKEAFEFLRDGFTGYAIRRQGVTAAGSTGVTAGEFVDVVPIEVGKAIPGRSSADTAGIYTFSAPVAVTGAPAFNVAAAA